MSWTSMQVQTPMDLGAGLDVSFGEGGGGEAEKR